MFPSFDYRQWYQTDINNINEVRKHFLDFKINDNQYFRGMADYNFICISTFYRYYVANNPDLDWKEYELDVARKISLPIIDTEVYKNLSFAILDEFENNLLKLGGTKLSFNSIIYLAQHYGLPTNLIDFTFDPKIALYFACQEHNDKDCVIYMYDIFHHINKKISQSLQISHPHNYDDLAAVNETALYYKKLLTTIDRNGEDIVTPEIKLGEINLSKRILNQHGAFVYHNDSKPFDLIMFNASHQTAFHKRRVYKINKELKPTILEILDNLYGINKAFIYPDIIDDPNIEIIEEAVKLTKDKLNIQL